MGGPCLSAAREVNPSLGSQGWPVDNGNRHSVVESESTHTVSESCRSMIPEPVSMRSMMNSSETPSIKWRIPNWRRFLPYIGGMAALLLFAAALVILHSHAQAYRPSEVRRALRALQAWQPFAALGLAAASYVLLTLYDVLALRHIGRTLPYRRVALALHRICLQPCAGLRECHRPLSTLPNLHAYGTERR